jgi:hypothetical protein
VNEHSARFLMSLRKFKAEYWDQKSAFMRVNMDDLAMFLRWIDERNADQPEAARPLHYWTGYGTLCFTTDARKRDSQVAPDRARVTCERCLTLLARLDSTTGQQSPPHYDAALDRELTALIDTMPPDKPSV